MRRTLLIILVAILLIGGGVGIYFYFFKNTASVTVSPAGSTSLPAAGQVGSGGTTNGTSSTTQSTTPGVPIKVSARLIQIDPGPVVPGERIAPVPAASASSSPDIAVHYIQRESGNVYAYYIHAGTLTRTSNRTIPGIQNALWLPDASAAFVQFLSGADFGTVNTYRLMADGSDGAILPSNISEMGVSSTTLLTLVSGTNGSSASVSNLDGSKSSPAFTTPLTQIHAQVTGKSYFVYTKPSAGISGYAFKVDAKGVFSYVAGPRKGLVALPSPSGKWALVSYSDGPALRLELIAIATGIVTQLPVATIADKCVWAADESSAYCGVPISVNTANTYPDDWYQGAVHFADRIWKIDVQGRYASLVLDFSKETNTDLDATSLTLDSGNQDLVFLNKNDGSLWMYQL